MANPQSAIFEEGSTCAWFLEYTCKPDVPLEQVRQALLLLYRQKNKLVHRVVCFGPEFWRLLDGEQSGVSVHPFRTIDGVDGYCAPSTQHDIFIWLHGMDKDALVEFVMSIQSALSCVADLRLDVQGFRYRDGRDLTGFVDGTANPKDDLRMQAALIPEDKAGAGGAFVLSQRWCHQLSKFQQLPLHEQEKVIGRTKVDDVELTGDDMPEDSHVSRTDVKGMKIYRRSMPWANATEQGLYFLAFACEQTRFDVQLARMFGASGDGLHDRLVEFSIPTNSAYWFAPSETLLASKLAAID